MAPSRSSCSALSAIDKMTFMAWWPLGQLQQACSDYVSTASSFCASGRGHQVPSKGPLPPAPHHQAEATKRDWQHSQPIGRVKNVSFAQSTGFSMADQIDSIALSTKGLSHLPILLAEDLGYPEVCLCTQPTFTVCMHMGQ